MTFCLTSRYFGIFYCTCLYTVFVYNLHIYRYKSGLFSNWLNACNDACVRTPGLIHLRNVRKGFFEKGNRKFGMAAPRNDGPSEWRTGTDGAIANMYTVKQTAVSKLLSISPRILTDLKVFHCTGRAKVPSVCVY